MGFKVKFVDFWDTFDPEDSKVWTTVKNLVDVELGEEPDVVFFSCFGYEHEKYPDAIKVYYTGENIRPNRFACDYSIGFDYSRSRRHFRYPLYDTYAPEVFPVGNREKFCSIVVSNSRSQMRMDFLEKLSARKRVDSGGRLANNIGGPVASKGQFISQYRFNIALENSSYPGYTTEKLFEAKNAGCIPIYWGDPRVAEEFDPAGFIDISRFPSLDRCIEHILEVDANPELLAKYQNTPLFPHGSRLLEERDKALRAFLVGIFNEGTQRWKNPILSRMAARWNHQFSKLVDRRALAAFPETRWLKSGVTNPL